MQAPQSAKTSYELILNTDMPVKIFYIELSVMIIEHFSPWQLLKYSIEETNHVYNSLGLGKTGHLDGYECQVG